ncbi:ATP-binding protein [Naasia lichenicola]|nr:AAA family ATPase [Naasia lichenicola]
MLELRLFGPPRVRLDGTDLRFDTRKAVALLAFLAVSDREHARDSIAAMLWPELERGRARAVLRRTLSVATAVGPALRIGPDGIGLDADDLSCDVRRFRELAADSDPSSWREAATIAADGFLEGFSLRDSPPFEDWQLATSEGLRDTLSQVLARLVADAVTQGELPTALEHARHRTRVDPLSEPAHSDLIRVTAWTGDRPGALSAYRALVRLLDAELGVPPLPETLALQEDIRGDRLTPPALPRPSATRAARPSGSGWIADAPVPAVGTGARLVGRAVELAAFERAWSHAANVGRCLGLVGEPGMGKSTILRAASATVKAQSFPTLHIEGRISEQPLAYSAAIDLIRGMLTLRPDLPQKLGAAGEPLAALAAEFDGAGAIRGPGDLHRVHEAVRTAIEACVDGRLLITVDDAHLLDGPSAALLAYVVRRPPPGVLVLATWTSGAGGAMLPEAVIEQGEAIALGPLSLDAVAELTAGTGLDPAEVLRRTRGLPLLVREYGTSGGDLEVDADALAAARAVVAARYDSAPTITRQLLAAAAIIGTVADPELIRLASGRDEAEAVDAIEDAIERGLLVERSDRSGYDLPHELAREVALAHLSLARSRLLHGRIAEVLARRHAVDPLTSPAGAVARHLTEAGRDEDAGRWFLRAAKESSRLLAHSEELLQLETALALGQRGPDVQLAIGRTRIRLGRYRDALVSLDQAAALAEGDPVLQAEVEHTIASVHDRLGDWDLAHAHLDAALPLAQTAQRARILADLALVSHRQGRPIDAEAAAREAARIAGETDDRIAIARADNVLGVLAASRGDRNAAGEHLASAITGARAIADLDLLIAALNNSSRALQTSGEQGAALDAAREAVDLAERQGDRHRLAALHSHVADLLHEAGREAEALDELKLSAAAFADIQGSDARPEVWTLSEW